MTFTCHCVRYARAVMPHLGPGQRSVLLLLGRRGHVWLYHKRRATGRTMPNGRPEPRSHDEFPVLHCTENRLAHDHRAQQATGIRDTSCVALRCVVSIWLTFCLLLQPPGGQRERQRRRNHHRRQCLAKSQDQLPNDYYHDKLNATGRAGPQTPHCCCTYI